MYILGISCFYHDSAATLLKDGELIAAVEEERFTRKKHDASFALNAIQFCFKQAGITAQDLSYVGFYEKPVTKFDRLLSQHLEMFPRSFHSFYKAMPNWLTEKLRVPSIIKKKMGYRGPILFVDHHMAHAASAYLVSPFENAAVLTTDGVGEWTTTTIGHAKGNDIYLAKSIEFPHSLGLLYSTVTAYLGFKVNNDEYKVMGLAPYGKPTYVGEFKKVIDIKPDGSYTLDTGYFYYHYKLTMPSKKFIQLFGPPREPEGPLEERHKNIAASVQQITEEVQLLTLNQLYLETKCTNLCIAGGVALNSVANGKIREHTPFTKIFIQPAASDAGTSLGVAYYIWNTILKNKKRFTMQHAYWGPEFSTDEIRTYLQDNQIVRREFSNDTTLLRTTAKLLWDNHVVGWFQGRMEWGPRALGARSILSNPSNPHMKDILNLKVKHREKFRPFAPVIPVEDVPTYFEVTGEVPTAADFMLMVFPIKKTKQNLLPAVTHVDGSGRLQTIRREQNQRYYDLIREFEKLSGVPILVNTSFNIRGEPIVCTPAQAYRCMMGTGIDYVVMDRFLIARADNPKDMWDSESIAKD